MKITHNKVGQNLNTSDTKKSDKAEQLKDAKTSALDPKASEAAATKVQVSTRAQDLKKIKELATSAPDVNEAKVARLQKMIDEGSYKTDAKAVADKMVDEHMMFS